MDAYGLIGYPLGHSFSARYFNEKFAREGIDAAYRLYPLKEADEGTIMTFVRETPDLRGFNVTIPYKETVCRMCDMLTEEASAIGAVNAVRVEDDGKLSGTNTDQIAFLETLRPYVKPGDRALVLGTGGASKAVRYALECLGIPCLTVSRNPHGEKTIDYAYLHAHPRIMADHRIIVNTTPLGMWPETETAPDIPYDRLSPSHLCYDLVYNPEETLFMRMASEHGATAVNGLEMLRRQAEEAWKFFGR